MVGTLSSIGMYNVYVKMGDNQNCNISYYTQYLDEGAGLVH